MVAYSFQRQFADPILMGRKKHTIRAPRKRHARPGEALQLYTGMRTKTCRLIARATCEVVEPIKISFGARIVDDRRWINGHAWRKVPDFADYNRAIDNRRKSKGRGFKEAIEAAMTARVT